MRSMLCLAALALAATGCATDAPQAISGASLDMDANAGFEVTRPGPVRMQAGAVETLAERSVTDDLRNPEIMLDRPEPVTAMLDCGQGPIELEVDQDSVAAVAESPAAAVVDVIDSAWVPEVDRSLIEVLDNPARHLDPDGAHVALDTTADAAPWMVEAVREGAELDLDADMTPLDQLREEACRATEGCGGTYARVDMDASHDLLVSVDDEAIVGVYEACRLVVARD